MGRPATGTAYFSDGHWFASVSLGAGKRKSIKVPSTSREGALARARFMTQLVVALREADQTEFIEPMIKKAAELGDDKLADLRKYVIGKLCGGKKQKDGLGFSVGMTFGQLAGKWLTEELHREFPDHVSTKRTAYDDRKRLEKHVFPHVEDVPLETFALSDAEAVMRALPPRMSRSSRRHIAQLMHRVLKLAVYPARIIERSPIPANWLPRVGPSKASPYLYPAEDAKLMRGRDMKDVLAVPLVYRLLYGFLAREGMRRGEAAALEWKDVDLYAGAVRIDENKTDDARAWALDPGVAEALARWRKMRPNATRVFELDDGAPVNVDKLAGQLRDDLEAVGVKRAELFENTDSRRHIVAHSLRATFVTLSLAAGRSETWVADRTGHRSSAMINRYRRAARSVTELGLGTLDPLVDAIPELCESGVTSGVSSGGGRARGRDRKEDTRKQARAEVAELADAPDSKDNWKEPRAPKVPESVDIGEPPGLVDSPPDSSPTAPRDPNGGPLVVALDALNAQLRTALATNDAPSMRRLRDAIDALLAPIVDASTPADVAPIKRGRAARRQRA